MLPLDNRAELQEQAGASIGGAMSILEESGLMSQADAMAAIEQSSYPVFEG
jgi:hypothetical protein